MTYPPNDIRYDSPLYIRELQLRLRDLSYLHPSLPRIEIDGIFGEETAAAVLAAQALFDLPQNGVVNLPTWSAVTAAHRTAQTLRIPLAAEIFPSASVVLRAGDSGDTVAIVQHMLHAAARPYGEAETIALTGTVDPPTVRAFRRLQEVGGLPVTGNMDIATWNVLARLYNTLY